MSVATVPAERAGPQVAPSVSPVVAGKRLASLDAFRGITIAGMILVNNPGTWETVYGPLLHATWHGWTPTDLVFPFFLFIVGVAITFAYRKRLARGVDRGPLVAKAVKRTLILIGLGLFLAAFPFVTATGSFIDLSTLRYPGVLQRIAVCYLIVTLLFLYTSPRTQIATAIALLFGYWALMEWVPVPGFGAGLIDQPEATLSAYIDRVVFGQHLWASTGATWDPEGLLSTMPSIVSTMIGVWTGHILLSDRDRSEKALRLFAWGFALTTAGYMWDWFFPINKMIWTSSYAVFTGGLAMSMLAACYLLLDVHASSRRSKTLSKPFITYGMNAIAIYVLSGVLARLLGVIQIGDASLKSVLYEGVFAGLGSPEFSSMLFALTWVAGFGLLAWWMYRRELFIKV
jgi:predicted acyltransferase